MCGIAASFSSAGTATALDLKTLDHRGPDGRGEWVSPDGRLWFGHTRLAIVDLSATGAQPMCDAESGNVIVFNGEIYNHAELREQMREAKIAWVGSSDTETLLVGFRLWGEALLQRVRGMFAFAIYEAKEKRLFVARDPLGIKPLYFHACGHGVRLASEMRTLMEGQYFDCSREGISAFLQWGSCPEAALLFPEIKTLAAGHRMIVETTGAIDIRRFWPPQTFPVNRDADAPAQIRALLERSVREHLVADVPVAAFLSGGIDSSVVTALASREMGGTALQTFSIGFPHAQFDETDIAAQVAKRYRTDHHRIEVSDEEAIGFVQEAVENLDAPSIDAINTFIVSRKVAQCGIKVALSGLGADELFGGYPSFRDAPRLRMLARIPAPLRRLTGAFGKAGSRLADLPSGDLISLAVWRRRLWSDAMLRDAGLPISELQTDAPPPWCDDFATISWAELTVYMRQMLLRDSDQMSMASSLELRVPFLDIRLVEYALSLPAKVKTRYGMPKGILIEACRDLLPEQVYNRPKMGFSLPMDTWMRGPLQAFANSGLDEIETRHLLSPDTVGKIRQRFERRAIHWTRLWSLVVLGHYVRKCASSAPSTR